MTIRTLERGGLGTEVLFIHAPYPGQLRFESQPSSLLSAAGQFLCSALVQSGEVTAGYLDPGDSSEEFYEELAVLLREGAVRAVCISSSTAGIEEAARIARLAKLECPRQVLVIAGGPHEDDIEEKMAVRLAEVDISIAGDAEHVLGAVLVAYLGQPLTVELDAFLLGVPDILGRAQHLCGRGSVASRLWGRERSVQAFDFGAVGVESITERPWTKTLPRFSVFDTPTTLPFMVSRGCSYGQCTFCAEAVLGRASQQVADDFAFIEELIEKHPESSLYFQDSIFPNTAPVRERLLPMLKESGRQWGAQVYLRTLSESFLELLAESGMTYLYTGLESASAELTAAVGKPGLNQGVAKRRLEFASQLGVRLGVSLMVGVMSAQGELLETPETLEASRRFIEELRNSGIKKLEAFLNVQTVLPGTALDRGLRQAGHALDFYRMPKCEELRNFEDGFTGYNAFSIESVAHKARRSELLRLVAAMGARKPEEEWLETLS